MQVKIDRDRAAAFGVTPQQIETALGAAFGGQQISQINTSSNQYQVILELLPQYQRDASALTALYITGTNGTAGAADRGDQHHVRHHAAQRQPFRPAAGRDDLLRPGAGQGAVATRSPASATASDAIGMPATVQGSFQGTAAAFQSSTQNMGMLLLIAMIVVYIILGILYESFIHPLTILSGLPSAAVGALLTLFIFGMPLTLYAFVGMIMLIGIVKKNAIMMIDFALQPAAHRRNVSRRNRRSMKRR